MKCPRCGEINQENNKICSGCGLKLKIKCPKCQSLNTIGREKCLECSFRLMLICPYCKVPNNPAAKECRKCGKKFEIQDNDGVKTPSGNNDAQDFAVLAIELVNLSEIKEKVGTDDLVANLLKKFYQIAVAEAKKQSETVKRISDNLIFIEFKNADSVKMSAIHSVVVIQRILEEVKELNCQIEAELQVQLELKAGISIKEVQNKNDFAELERLAAEVGDVVVITKAYSLIFDAFDFEELGVHPENDEIIFYKVKDAEIEINLESIQNKEQESINKSVSQENAYNSPDAKKRGNEILQTREKLRKVDKSPKYEEIKEVSQEGAYNTILEILTKENKGFIIGISGLDGVGKSTAISTVKQNFSNDKYIWLIGLCQPVNRIIPFAFFQDLLKSIFNLPPVIFDIAESKKIVAHSLDKIGIKDKKIENVLHKLLFYENLSADISGLFNNQIEVYESIKTVLNSFNAKNNIILVVDDLEFIDNASLGCIRYIIENNFLNQGNFIVVNYSSNVDLSDYFISYDYRDRIIRLHLNLMNTEEMNKALLGMLNNQDIIPQQLKERIFDKSKGFPIYLEQLLWLLFQTKTVYSEHNKLLFNMQAENMALPETVDDIIKTRLSQINSLNPDSFRVMLSASLFGQRFMPSMVQLMLGIERQQFTNLIQMLLSNGIFINFDNHTALFKHKTIWNVIYNQWLSAEQKADYHNQAFEVLKNHTRVCTSVLAMHAELAKQPQKAIDLWGQGAIEAISTGDLQSYVVSQQQVLSLLDQVVLPDESEKAQVKNQICENIGRISYEANPQEAIDYLSGVIIEKEKNGQVSQVIELTGYLAKSCELTGNYSGVVECVDKAISGIDRNNLPFEYALLCSSKLEALLNLGRLEETIIIAKNNVIPVLKEVNSMSDSVSGLSKHELACIQLNSELTLAKAFAFQGNKESIDMANSVANKAKELGLSEIELQARLIEALYRVLQGRIKASNASLVHLKEMIPQIKNSNLVKLYCGFVEALSLLLNGNYSRAGNLCHTVLMLAEVCNEYSIQGIIRLLMAKVLSELGNHEKAKIVYNELILYCSEYKQATGALLGWYLIAQLEKDKGDIAQAEAIAQRALEVAQKASINNCFFIILLRKLLSEVQIVKGDFEGAIMYSEQAMNLANKMELYLLQSELYLIYGKIYSGIASGSEVDRAQNIHNAHKAYQSSLEMAKMIDNDHMSNIVKIELSNFKAFCQNLNINIEN